MKSKIVLTEKDELDVINFYCMPNSAREVERKFGVNLYQLDKLLIKYNLARHDKKTCLELRQQKMYDTNIKKYGVQNIFQAETTKEKIKNTLLTKYGVEFVGQIAEAKEKSTKIFLQKYGVKRYSQTAEFKKFYAENASIFKNKEILTKIKNGTAASSAPEKIYLNELIKIFGENDVLQQYKSDKYPYHCDFYIKSIDTYIELNLHWTHGNHKFLNNTADIEKLEKWKKLATTSKFYATAIYVWTELDPKKQKIAAENNLNYITIYDEKDWLSWIKN